MSSYRPLTDLRFWSMVEARENCLIWTGRKNADGYGEVFRQRKVWKAHRWAWFIQHGSVPPELDHICKNRACVKHLRPIAHAENIARRERPRCKHEYDQLDKKNGAGYPARRCSICRADQVKRAKLRFKSKHG